MCIFRILLLGVLISIAGVSFGQVEYGWLYGRVLDEKKQPIVDAIVVAKQGGIIKGVAATDYEGNYEIKPLEPGKYDIVVTYMGYDTIRSNDVLLVSNVKQKADFAMLPHNWNPNKHHNKYSKQKRVRLIMNCKIRKSKDAKFGKE